MTSITNITITNPDGDSVQMSAETMIGLAKLSRGRATAADADAVAKAVDGWAGDVVVWAVFQMNSLRKGDPANQALPVTYTVDFDDGTRKELGVNSMRRVFKLASKGKVDQAARGKLKKELEHRAVTDEQVDAGLTFAAEVVNPRSSLEGIGG